MSELTAADIVAMLETDTKAEGPQQFTAAARLAAAEYARGRMKGGARLEEAAAELKLKKWTLQKWLQRHGRGELEGQRAKGSRFVRVRVKPKESESPSRLVVHGAHGVRVEGLTLENIATLLERLGCSA